MVIADVYPLFLLALVTWREARGEVLAAKIAVACSIRNRILHPRWWGRDNYISVILMPWQYSSFNRTDPNSTKFPVESDPTWQDCLAVAESVYNGTQADVTGGADSYFDRSMDLTPPSWATDHSKTHTCDVGNLHFYLTN